MIWCLIGVISICACKKLVEVPEPVNTITTAETFTTPENATAALMQVYSNMAVGPTLARRGYANCLITLYTGLSSDELNYFSPATETAQLQTNSLDATNSLLYTPFWSAAYYDIYTANAIIEGVSASSSLNDSVRSQLIGEAKFMRSFIYFYLLNVFGEVPLVTSTLYINSSVQARTSSSIIYDQIVSDLKDAEAQLPADYSASHGERIRANKYAASALLSRVYLYMKKWDLAAQKASSLINSTVLYHLENDLNNIFLKNSSEAILQLQTQNVTPYSTPEGRGMITSSHTARPTYYVSAQLYAAFEPSDKRKKVWLDSTKFSTQVFYFPFKYKVFTGQVDNIKEYYMMLRLSEQFLIRAEANAQLNNLSVAISDLNIIRNRAGLPNLSASLTQDQVLAAVAQERRIELFAEWGHRWFDLKRTNRADSVLSLVKGNNWQPFDKLYPIPKQELINDPNLSQNDGYN